MRTYLLDRATKRAVSSLSSEADASFADPSFGESISLEVGVVNSIRATTAGTRLYDPEDVAGWTFRAAISLPNQSPLAGTYTITYGANTTTALAFNASAATVQTALNLLASIISAGGVTVSSEGDGYFVVSFTNAGARSDLALTTTNLAPVSIGEQGILIDGTGSLAEVQTIRILQNPAAYVELSTSNDPADATVDVLQVGGGGNNHKIRVTLDPLPYDGRWTLNIDGEESELLSPDISETDLITALEAMTIVGADNVSAVLESAGVYLIAFKGAHANEDMGTITADPSALKVISTKGGALDLRTPGIELLLGDDESVSAYLEIEGTPPGGNAEKLYREQITIVAPIITPASLTPEPLVDFYTAAEADAEFKHAGDLETHLAAPTSPPGNSIDSSIMAYLDEFSGNLCFQVRKSGGVTETVTIPFDP